MSVRANCPGPNCTLKSRRYMKTLKNCPKGYVCTRKAHFASCPRDYVRVSNGRCRKLRKDEYYTVYRYPWKYFSKTELDHMNYSIQELLDRNATPEDLIALGYDKHDIDGLEAKTMESELAADQPIHMHERVTPASIIVEPDDDGFFGHQEPLEEDVDEVDDEPLSERPELKNVPEPEPEPEPVPEPKPEPEPEPEPTSESEPAFEPAPEPEPTSESEPAFEPAPEPEPTSESEPESEPTFEPAPTPEPEPVFEMSDAPSESTETPHDSADVETKLQQKIKDFDKTSQQYYNQLRQLSESVGDD